MTTHAHTIAGNSGYPLTAVTALCGAKVDWKEIRTTDPVDCPGCRANLEHQVQHFSEMMQEHPGSRSTLMQGRRIVERLLG